MLVFPNCKINLGLHVVAKRPDGFHNLETVFYPILLKDALEAVRSPGSSTILYISGLTIEGDNTDNICIKAYGLLKNDFPDLPPLDIYLHKAIPLGAGLGGGSADGAFMLRLLNEKFQLSITEEKLLHYAAQLGSDCPFFIINQPCYATGRGEKLERIGLDLSAFQIVLVNPGIHVNTGAAFKALTPAPPAQSIMAIIQQPVETWKDQLHNDFEKPVFTLHPEIALIKSMLYENGAVYAAMSGSGSTVFGLFKKPAPALPAFPAHYLVKTV
jgi:4-diphosphocytidyl-2-C-methyl-D-erythritol kinase